MEKGKIIENGNVNLKNLVVEEGKKELLVEKPVVLKSKIKSVLINKEKTEVSSEWIELFEEIQKWYEDENSKEDGEKFLKRLQSIWLLKKTNLRFEYVYSILAKKLRTEEEDLSMWEKTLENSNDELAKKQSHGNISPTQSRIEELKKAIEILPTQQRFNRQ